MTWKRIGAVATLASYCAAFPPLARAQEPAPEPVTLPVEEPRTTRPAGKPITLSQVIERARHNPPAVMAALATLERFQAQEHLARAAYLPKLSLGAQGGVQYNNFPYLVSRAQGAPPAETGDLLTDLNNRLAYLASQTTRNVRLENTTMSVGGTATVDWALLDMSRNGNIDLAKAQSLQQSAAYAASQRVALQAAVALYVRGLSAQLLIDDARLSKERREDQLKSIAALVRAGVRPSVDAQRAEIEAVAARHWLEVRTIEHQAAMAALASALGEDPANPLRPVEFEHDPFVSPTTLREATELATRHRPEIKQGEAAVIAAQANHRASIGMRLPVLGLTGQGQISYNEVTQGTGIEGRTQSASGIAYLRWSALDPTTWRRAKVTSKAVIETQRMFEATLLQLKAQVAEALYAAQVAKAQLDRATETLAAATTTRQAQNERYRAGVSTLLELLDAEELEQNARRGRIEAARDYDLARAQLLAVCGTIDKVR